MPEMMLKLGDYPFSIDTAAYQRLQRTTQYRWAAQSRVGKHDALQFTGYDADQITLTGRIYPTWRAGPHQIRDMRATASKGDPLMLVDGNGYIHGRWVILGVEEQSDIFAVGGAPRRQSFTMTMRFFDDGPQVQN